MKMCSLSIKDRHASILRRAAVALVAFVAGGLAMTHARTDAAELLRVANARQKSSQTPLQHSPPALTVETDVWFQYEQWTQMLSRVPTAPNNWHIESKITNNGPGPIEVLPVYLYSEVRTGKAVTSFENSATICPKSFAYAFGAEAQKGLTIAPADLSGKIEATVGLPMDQLNEVPDLSRGGSIAAMVGSRSFAAALSVDAKPVAWEKFSSSPHSTITADWEFASIWAASQKVRNDPSFEMIHLGPIIRPASPAPGEAYLVVVRLSYAPKESGGSMKQSSVQFMRVTSSLPKNLSNAFPDFPSVAEFGNATARLAGDLR